MSTQLWWDGEIFRRVSYEVIYLMEEAGRGCFMIQGAAWLPFKDPIIHT